MSRSHTLFDQWYECGDKKFLNIWQAFDYQKESGHFPLYKFDPEFIENIKNIKRPKNLNHQYIKNLIVNRLKQLRKEHKFLRLALGGGTDSFSILKYCIEHDIYIDEVFTWMLTIDQKNVRNNIEYLPALKFAEKHVGQTVGKVLKLYPTIRDAEFTLQNGWYRNDQIIVGNHLPARSAMFSHYYKITDLPIDETITIFGFDKPYIQKENNQMYWTQIDGGISEIMGCKNILPLFYDKHNPELTVSMAYALLENSNTDHDFIGYDTQPSKNKLQILHAMGLESTGHHYLDFHLWGKEPFEYQNKKNIIAQKELQKLGRQDIIDAYFKTLKIIILQYKELPYGIEIKNNIYAKATNRFCQKVPIYQDSFGS